MTHPMTLIRQHVVDLTQISSKPNNKNLNTQNSKLKTPTPLHLYLKRSCYISRLISVCVPSPFIAISIIQNFVNQKYIVRRNHRWVRSEWIISCDTAC